MERLARCVGFAIPILAACGSPAVPTVPTTDPTTTDPTCTEDVDGDGLSDCAEIELGTAVQLADTDGDGILDGREIELERDPRIADRPRFTVRPVAPPEVTLQTAPGDPTGTVPVPRADPTTTLMPSSMHARAVEWTVWPGGSLVSDREVGLSDGPVVRPAVAYGSALSTTREQSLVWTELQRQEHLAAFDTILGDGSTFTGARFEMPLELVNEADGFYTVTDLGIEMWASSPFLDDALFEVGTLEPLADAADRVRVGPDGSALLGLHAVVGPGYEAGTALFEASRLEFRITDYRVEDDTGEQPAFEIDAPDTFARTATVIVDVGERGASRRWQVATQVGDRPEGILAVEVLDDVLRIPYELDPAGRLIGLDGVFDGDWLAVHAGGNDASRTFLDRGQRFDDIELGAGDVLHLVRVDDIDDDGIGERQEGAMSTEPEVADTDSDGRTDGEEFLVDLTDPRVDTRLLCPATAYDVDGDAANGCEVLDEGPDNHTQGSATDLGGRSCEDTDSDPGIAGRLVSDRARRDPAVAGFDPAVGAAPDWYRIFADGGLFCQNDVSLTLRVEGTGELDCYELTVFTNVHASGLRCSTDLEGRCVIDASFGEYTDDTDLFVRVSRICEADGADVTYTVSGHL